VSVSWKFWLLTGSLGPLKFSPVLGSHIKTPDASITLIGDM
jgi:hypothetical protein